MTSQEIGKALLELDRLYLDRSSFSAWLKGTDTAEKAYEQKRAEIEAACPGLKIVYVDITYKVTHALVANDEENE